MNNKFDVFAHQIRRVCSSNTACLLIKFGVFAHQIRRFKTSAKPPFFLVLLPFEALYVTNLPDIGQKLVCMTFL